MSDEEVIEASGDSVEKGSPESSESDRPTLDDLIEYARSGWYLWHDRKYNRIRLRDPETGKTLSIPYDPEIYERLKKAKDEGKKGRKEEKPAKKPPVTSDIMLWNTFIGKHRPLIESLISRIGWLQEAVLDIGMNTLLMTLIIADESPEKLVEVLRKIRDRNEFVGYVMDKLFNIYLSTRDVEIVSKLRERIKELEVQVAILEDIVRKRNEEIERLKVIAGDLKTKLDMALSIMSSDELRRLMKAYTVSAINMYMSRRREAVEEHEVEEGGGVVE